MTHTTEKPIDLAIGQKVRAQREAHNRSLADTANALGVSPSVYSACEAGRRAFPASDLFALADYFGCRARDMMPDEKSLRSVPAAERFGEAEDVRDLIHYFSGVVSPELRGFFLSQIRDASIQEAQEQSAGANVNWGALPKRAKPRRAFGLLGTN